MPSGGEDDFCPKICVPWQLLHKFHQRLHAGWFRPVFDLCSIHFSPWRCWECASPAWLSLFTCERSDVGISSQRSRFAVYIDALYRLHIRRLSAYPSTKVAPLTVSHQIPSCSTSSDNVCLDTGLSPQGSHLPLIVCAKRPGEFLAKYF